MLPVTKKNNQTNKHTQTNKQINYPTDDDDDDDDDDVCLRLLIDERKYTPIDTDVMQSVGEQWTTQDRLQSLASGPATLIIACWWLFFLH